MPDPYDVLDVPADADEDAVRSAYRELLKEHHPDHGGSADRFIRIREAYETLVSRESGGGIVARRDRAGGAITRTPRTARSVQGEDGPALVAETGGLSARLVALTDRLPAGAMLPDHVEPGRRVAACFRVENGGGRPITWRVRRVRFVDGTGERRMPTVYRPKRRRLPEPWRGDDVDLDPGEAAHSILLSRSLPEEVGIEALVYEGRSADGPERPLRFDLDGDVRDALDRDPFGSNRGGVE